MMRAAWYERTGPAREVLQVGELPEPEPGPGEVRVRLTRSGVNPGDVKKREGWVVGTVRHTADVAGVPTVALDAPDAAARIRELAPDGVDRIVEVALSVNADLDAEVAAPDAVIAAYASPDPRPALPFWPLLFANV